MSANEPKLDNVSAANVADVTPVVLALIKLISDTLAVASVTVIVSPPLITTTELPDTSAAVNSDVEPEITWLFVTVTTPDVSAPIALNVVAFNAVAASSDTVIVSPPLFKTFVSSVISAAVNSDAVPVIVWLFVTVTLADVLPPRVDKFAAVNVESAVSVTVIV